MHFEDTDVVQRRRPSDWDAKMQECFFGTLWHTLVHCGRYTLVHTAQFYFRIPAGVLGICKIASRIQPLNWLSESIHIANISNWNVTWIYCKKMITCKLFSVFNCVRPKVSKVKTYLSHGWVRNRVSVLKKRALAGWELEILVEHCSWRGVFCLDRPPRSMVGEP